MSRTSYLLLLLTSAFFSNVETVSKAETTAAAASASASCRPRSLPFQYVISCGIAVEPLHRRVGSVRPNTRVSFHTLTSKRSSSISNNKHDDTYILTNIVDTGRKHHVSKQPIYEAVIVDPRQWQSQLDWNRSNNNGNNSRSKKKKLFKPFRRHAKTLWCVHDGGTSSPREWFRQCSQYHDDGRSKYTIVPVLWPAGDKVIRGYMNDDLEVSPDAAEVFRPLLQIAQSLRHKPSIVCLGIGNYVLKLTAAAASVPRHSNSSRNRRRTSCCCCCCFDHIFMVAAHMRHDLFDSVRNKNEKHVEQNHGKRIAALAQRKVHNLYSTRDLALYYYCRRLPWHPSLGRQPIHPQKLSKDLRHQVVNHDCNAFNHWHWKTNRLWHHYLFHKDAIQYYESAAK